MDLKSIFNDIMSRVPNRKQREAEDIAKDLLEWIAVWGVGIQFGRYIIHMLGKPRKNKFGRS